MNLFRLQHVCILMLLSGFQGYMDQISRPLSLTKSQSTLGRFNLAQDSPPEPNENAPTVIPTFPPIYSQYQSLTPNEDPISSPSQFPSSQPTSSPSSEPSTQPTSNPSSQPSGQPSNLPTSWPTNYPTLSPTSAPSQPTGQPTSQPSCEPSRQPSAQPSSNPTSPTSQPSSQPTNPTGQPSRQPTSQPSRQPSSQPTNPTGQPTSEPSAQPSRQPSAQPSKQPFSWPTTRPSCQPSSKPSTQPSTRPTSSPTSQPNGRPTSQPSQQPSSQPSGQPFSHPSSQPSRQPSSKPSRQPSSQPSLSPTCQPSVQPSSQPVGRPSSRPSAQPSNQPSSKPSRQPSSRPTAQPSRQPSSRPSSQPVLVPTSQPSNQPTSQPSMQPILRPTSAPSQLPTASPSQQPSSQPSVSPSGQPVSRPTSVPTFQPTSSPSSQPSVSPSSKPSCQPTSSPTAQPFLRPTSIPSAQPVSRPSSQPTSQPTAKPSSQPVMRPSSIPTVQPSGFPTNQPTAQPSSSPTLQPAADPTSQPSVQPTSKPSCQPSVIPSSFPTCQPSSAPSAQPSSSPSDQPTSQPTVRPTSQPSSQPSTQPSEQPSSQPTSQPIGHPSSQPSQSPSSRPTGQPSCQPSAQPSESPTIQPSSQPTSSPTRQPTQMPSGQPSVQPSNAPSAQPSVLPSTQPTNSPTLQPTSFPSSKPSSQPSTQPSNNPTVVPTCQPSAKPSCQPSGLPSSVPSSQPSSLPTGQPSTSPSSQPSGLPTSDPSAQPTSNPTTQPSGEPSRQPSGQPSLQPSGQPSRSPSGQPAASPTAQPVAQPTSIPTGQPSFQPSSEPSSQPSSEPSSQPASQPTFKPTSQPSSQPTKQPSSGPTAQPSVWPTSQPSSVPTCQPTVRPSGQPSSQPTGLPSTQPSSLPTSLPTNQPTSVPSMQPNPQPTSIPSTQPSGSPSSHPSSQPSSLPTQQPYGRPSSLPSTQPSGRPTGQPSIRPSRFPSGQPSGYPTGQPSVQPSSSPSVQPSVQPTSTPTNPTGQPTSMPTNEKAKSVPTISRLNTSAVNSTWVVATGTFLETPLYGGNAYCLAATSSSAISQQAIFLSSYFVAFDAGNPTFSVLLSNLYPSTTYYISCGVQTFLGDISSEANIDSIRLSVQTACCIQVSILSRPTFLLSNGSLYLSNQATGNTLQIQLGKAPSANLTVTPMLQMLNGSDAASKFRVIPTSQFFDGTSQSLLGNFYFVPRNVIGNFVVILKLTDADANDYTVNTFQLTVGNSSSIPAPTLLSAVFSGSGANVVITFDRSTDMALLSNTWTCSSLFEFEGSSSTSCSWTSTTQVFVTFPVSSSVSLLSVGDSVTLLANKLLAKCVIGNCRSSYAAQQSVKTSAPTNPLIPTITIKAAGRYTSCSDVVLDPTGTTGNGGRSWSFLRWNISAANGLSTSAIDSLFSGSTLQSIVLPSSLMLSGTYYATLQVRNFLGSTSIAGVKFVWGDGDLLPIVTLEGPSITQITSSSSLSLRGSVSVSSCNQQQSPSITYLWTVKTSTGRSLNIPSISKNPLTFATSSYAFNVSNTYEVGFSASVVDSQNVVRVAYATKTVQIISGQLSASIAGGSDVMLTSNRTLDASSSVDENKAGIQHLSFLWSCMVQSGASFGASCDSLAFGVNSLLRSSVVVSPKLLTAGIKYQIQVMVSTSDGRQSTASIVVQRSSLLDTVGPLSSATITSAPSIANPNGQWVIRSSIQVNSSVVATWSASIDGVAQSLSSSLSPTIRNFSSPGAMQTTVPFTLIVPAGNFQPGASVTFRLTLWASNAVTAYAYTQVSVKMNSIPSGGVVSATPANGTALVTKFEIVTQSWAVDASNLPLTYDFKYKLASTDSFSYTLQRRSTANTVTTILPEGTTSSGWNLLLFATVYDVVLTNATVSSYVTVKPSTSAVDYSTAVRELLTDATVVSDPDKKLQVLNAFSSQMNSVSCTLAPQDYCNALNRDACSSVVNTCGSCTSGFSGVVGAANTLCVNATATTTRQVGETCSSDSQCVYGECRLGRCIVPLQTCRTSSVDGSDCSGHGVCNYLLGNQAVVQDQCTVQTTACTPRCRCTDGYGGEDCAYSATEFSSREEARASICDAMLSVLALSDVTPDLVSTIAVASFNGFNPYELISTDALQSCLNASQSVLSLAAGGYLDVSSDSAVNALVQTLSNIVVSVDQSSSSNGRRRLLNATSNEAMLREQLASTSQTLVASILDAMEPGQSSLQYISNNFKVVTARSVVDDVATTALQLPQSASEVSYGKRASSVQVSPDFAAYCDDGEGYVSLSVGLWGNNPFSDDSSLESGLLRSQASAVGSSGNTLILNGDRRQLISFAFNDTPAYYVTLPFNEDQTFPASGERYGNYSIPGCSVYSTTGEQVACPRCNVSTYDNTSVVFACFDIADLCGRGRDSSSSVPVSLLRRLQQISTDDDDSGTFTIAQLGAVLTKIEKQFVQVLSMNPFSLDLERSKGVLGFVGSIFVVFVVGSVYFYMWDRVDRSEIIYVTRPKMLKPKEDEYSVKNSHASPRSPVSKSFMLFSTDDMQFSPRKKKRHHSMKLTRDGFTPEFVSHLLDAVIPLNEIDPASKSWFNRQIDAFCNHHEYMDMLGSASLVETRLIRWIRTSQNALLMLFVDTMFFSLFFDDTGYCEGLTTSSSCLEKMNSATNLPMCQWSVSSQQAVYATASCSLRPPPSNLIFTVLLSTLTLLVVLPIGFLLNFVREQVCKKRPNFEEIGLNSDSILGPAIHEIANPEASEEKVRSIVPINFTKSIAHINSSLDEDDEALVNLYFDQLVARTAYADHSSVQEEAAFFVREVRDFFLVTANNQPLPMHKSYTMNRMQAKTLAVQRYLGMRMDGSLTALSTFRSHFCGTNRSYVEQKLQTARRQVEYIERQVMKTSAAGLLEPDVALLQFFVLEQFPPFKRFILRYHFFDFPYASVSTVNPLLWIFSWIFLIGSQLFFIYWILAWSVSSGGKTFRSWGINEVLNVVEDFFLVQVILVYLIYVSTVETIVPQLRAIYCRLYEVALKSDLLKEKGVLDELRVVQFLSPACRAARRSRLSKLNAAKLLRCMDDIDVYYCRQQGRSNLGFLVVVAIAVPGLISMFAQDAADFVLKLVLPSVVNFGMIAFYLAYAFSLVFCVVMAVAVVVFALVRSSARDSVLYALGWKEKTWVADKELLQYNRIAGGVHDMQLGRKSWFKRVYSFVKEWTFQRKVHYRKERVWQVVNNPFATHGFVCPTPLPTPAVSAPLMSRVSFLTVNIPSVFDMAQDDNIEHYSTLMNMAHQQSHAMLRRVAIIQLKQAYRSLPSEVQHIESSRWNRHEESIQHQAISPLQDGLSNALFLKSPEYSAFNPTADILQLMQQTEDFFAQTTTDLLQHLGQQPRRSQQQTIQPLLRTSSTFVDWDAQHDTAISAQAMRSLNRAIILCCRERDRKLHSQLPLRCILNGVSIMIRHWTRDNAEFVRYYTEMNTTDRVWVQFVQATMSCAAASELLAVALEQFTPNGEAKVTDSERLAILSSFDVQFFEAQLMGSEITLLSFFYWLLGHMRSVEKTRSEQDRHVINIQRMSSRHRSYIYEVKHEKTANAVEAITKAFYMHFEHHERINLEVIIAIIAQFSKAYHHQKEMAMVATTTTTTLLDEEEVKLDEDTDDASRTPISRPVSQRVVSTTVIDIPEDLELEPQHLVSILNHFCDFFIPYVVTDDLGLVTEANTVSTNDREKFLRNFELWVDADEADLPLGDLKPSFFDWFFQQVEGLTSNRPRAGADTTQDQESEAATVTNIEDYCTPTKSHTLSSTSLQQQDACLENAHVANANGLPVDHDDMLFTLSSSSSTLSPLNLLGQSLAPSSSSSLSALASHSETKLEDEHHVDVPVRPATINPVKNAAALFFSEPDFSDAESDNESDRKNRMTPDQQTTTFLRSEEHCDNAKDSSDLQPQIQTHTNLLDASDIDSDVNSNQDEEKAEDEEEEEEERVLVMSPLPVDEEFVDLYQSFQTPHGVSTVSFVHQMLDMEDGETVAPVVTEPEDPRDTIFDLMYADDVDEDEEKEETEDSKATE